MTTFNTDYNNTELLDQELTTAELSQVSGGLSHSQAFEAERRKVDGPLPDYRSKYDGFIEDGWFY